MRARGRAGRFDREYATDSAEFFLSWAQTWCAVAPPSAAAQQLASEHAPNAFRVNGPLSQFAPFGQALKCPVGSAMNPPTRCEVW